MCRIPSATLMLPVWYEGKSWCTVWIDRRMFLSSAILHRCKVFGNIFDCIWYTTYPLGRVLHSCGCSSDFVLVRLCMFSFLRRCDTEETCMLVVLGGRDREEGASCIWLVRNILSYLWCLVNLWIRDDPLGICNWPLHMAEWGFVALWYSLIVFVLPPKKASLGFRGVFASSLEMKLLISGLFFLSALHSQSQISITW